MREIIDFHLHPFVNPAHSIAAYGHPADWKEFIAHLRRHGISRCAGSVIQRCDGTDFAVIRQVNDEALQFRDLAPAGFYVPGFHVHPSFPEESMSELERMHGEGVRLIGELVWYSMGYREYSVPALDPVWERAADLGMVLSIHPTEGTEDMARLLEKHPRLQVVIAHPGEYAHYMEKLELCKKYPNASLDICGTGLFRNFMLEYGVKTIGAERFLFATDYPTCNVGMQVGAVEYAYLTEEQRELIFNGNARRLLGLD